MIFQYNILRVVLVSIVRVSIDLILTHYADVKCDIDIVLTYLIQA